MGLFGGTKGRAAKRASEAATKPAPAPRPKPAPPPLAAPPLAPPKPLPPHTNSSSSSNRAPSAPKPALVSPSASANRSPRDSPKASRRTPGPHLSGLREASKDLKAIVSDTPSPRHDPDVFQSPQESHLHLVQSLKPGDGVYIAAAPSSHSEEAFHRCTVTKVAKTAVSVTLPSGEKKSVPPLEVLPAGSWQPKLSETHDLCALPSLNEAMVLAALQHRFNEQAIYTWIANLLVSLNPCQPRDELYGMSAMREFASRDLNKSPPHLYAIAEAAYRGATTESMLYPRSQQAVVVSGESGAGKSVAVKLLSEYLAWRATRQMDGNDEVRQVGMDVGRVLLLCRPVLEAFGNSTTAHNHNSSRFCKFISIGMVGGQFDAVTIATYLLERSRIVHHDPATERNFHVFYWLLQAGRPEEMELLPDKASKGHFAYLGGGRAAAETAAETAAAADKMEELRDALAAIGVPAEEQPGLFTLVAAVLQLGNIAFLGDASGGGSRVQYDEPLRLAAQGLGVDPGLLAKYLTNRPVVDRAQRSMEGLDSATEDNDLLKLLSPVEAARCRDSLAKAVYGHLFQWLVRRMNAALAAVRLPRHSGEETGEAAAADSIGLLDIFGFESFAVNSFEQLCINYANEQLHQLFVGTVFTSERAIHMAEGVPFPRIVLPDADAAIRAIAARPAGVLWLLDSSTRQLGARESAFFIAVNAEADRMQGDPEARVLPLPKRLRVEDAFVVCHYAGDVTYSAGGTGSPTWLDKNNSSLVPELHRAMLGSSSALVQQLFVEGGFGAARRGSSMGEYTDSPGLTRGSHGGSNRGSPGSVLGSSRASYGSPAPLRYSSPSTKRLEVESVSREFILNLDGLMAVLRASRLHFVRTVKPNRQLAADAFSPRMALRQLRCAGTHEAVHVMKLSYLSRVPYDQLFELLGSVLPAVFDPARLDRAHFVRCVLPELDVPDRAFALGHSRVFLKAAAAPLLEAALDRLKASDPDSSTARRLTMFATEATERWAAATAIEAAQRAKGHRREFAAKRRAAQHVQRAQRRAVQRQMFVARAREMAVELIACEAADRIRIKVEKEAAKETVREAQERAALYAASLAASPGATPNQAAPKPPPSGGVVPPQPPPKGTQKLIACHDSAAEPAPAVAPIPNGFPPEAAPAPPKKASSSRKRLGLPVHVVPDNKPAPLPKGWPPDLTSEEVFRLSMPHLHKEPLHSVPTREASKASSVSTSG